MGLTRCYKTTVLYIYFWSFSTKFILQMHIIAQAYLRCRGVASEFTRTTMVQILTVQYTSAGLRWVLLMLQH